MPFYELDMDTPARVVLEQTGPTKFRIVQPFRYVDPVTHEQFVVPDPRWGDQETDLASVPAILLWFVQRYGHHTLPALLHDQILNNDLRDQPERADRIFRDAMGEQGVHLVRRWLMWAAVSIRTIVVANWWRILPVAIWLLLFAALAIRVTPPLMAWNVPPFEWLVELPLWSAAAAAVGGPPVLSVLWGRRYLVGVIAGYGVFLFAVPILVIVLALAVYWTVEKLVAPLGTRRGGSGRLPSEPPRAQAEIRDVAR